MSVARAAAGAVIRPSKRAGTILLQRRAASSSAHEEHHHEHHEEHHDPNVYEPEGFNTPFWRRAALTALGVVAFYKYAPEPSDDTAIAKYIKSLQAPGELYQDISFKHLLLSAQESDETLLMVNAKPPTIHRYRYPQRLEQYSPNSHPVGINLSVGDIDVKRD